MGLTRKPCPSRTHRFAPPIQDRGLTLLVLFSRMRDMTRTIIRDGQVWRVFIECLPSGGRGGNKALIDNVFTREVRLVEPFPRKDVRPIWATK